MLHVQQAWDALLARRAVTGILNSDAQLLHTYGFVHSPLAPTPTQLARGGNADVEAEHDHRRSEHFPALFQRVVRRWALKFKSL